MSRPDHLIAVLGTGTGVGKTFLSAAFVRTLRSAGLTVVARKPVQSFAVDEADTTDAHWLAGASGEGAHDVCPSHRWYPAAMAPPMAAAHLGCEPFSLADLVAETRWPPRTAVGLIETVGGVHSPAAADGDSLALAAAFAPDGVVIVGDAGLGVINAVRLCLPPLAALCCPVTVLLNRFDPGNEVHQRNLTYLQAEGHDILTDVEALASRLTTPP